MGIISAPIVVRSHEFHDACMVGKTIEHREETPGRRCCDPHFCSHQFHARYQGDALSLMIYDESGHRIYSAPMDRGELLDWSISVPLSPGRYRFRYYGRQGDTTYILPESSGLQHRLTDGLDAGLEIVASFEARDERA